MQIVAGKARNMRIVNLFLFRVTGGEAQDRAWNSTDVLPVPVTARASRE
jgi:hypothetical protein